MLSSRLLIFIGATLAVTEDGTDVLIAQVKALKEMISNQQSQLNAMSAQLKQLDTMNSNVNTMDNKLRKMEEGGVVTILKEFQAAYKGFSSATLTTYAGMLLGHLAYFKTNVFIAVAIVVAAIIWRKHGELWKQVVNSSVFVWILPDIMSIFPNIGYATIFVALKFAWSDPLLLVIFVLLLALRFAWNIKCRLYDDKIMESAGVSFNFFQDAAAKKDFTFLATGNIRFCEIGLNSLQATLLSQRCTEEHKLLGFDDKKNAQLKILRTMTMCVLDKALLMPCFKGKSIAISLCFEPKPQGVRQFRIMVIAKDELLACTERLTDNDIIDEAILPAFIDNERAFPKKKQRKDRYTVMAQMRKALLNQMQNGGLQYVSLIDVPDSA